LDTETEVGDDPERERREIAQLQMPQNARIQTSDDGQRINTSSTVRAIGPATSPGGTDEYSSGDIGRITRLSVMAPSLPRPTTTGPFIGTRSPESACSWPAQHQKLSIGHDAAVPKSQLASCASDTKAKVDRTPVRVGRGLQPLTLTCECPIRGRGAHQAHRAVPAADGRHLHLELSRGPCACPKLGRVC